MDFFVDDVTGYVVTVPETPALEPLPPDPAPLLEGLARLLALDLSNSSSNASIQAR
jgi:hypothetical protein